MSIPSIIAIRDGDITGNTGAFYSPAKEKAANRDKNPFLFVQRFAIFRRFRNSFKLKLLLLVFCAVCVLLLFSPKLGPSLGGGYTVLVNTWKRNPLLKQSIAHYASCSRTDAIHVVWSDTDPPSESLKTYMDNTVLLRSRTAKPDLVFDVNEEDDLNNRFKPIEGLRTDAIFAVDDDVIVPCDNLDFAFAAWQTAPSAMVGFVPRMHWLSEKGKRSTSDHLEQAVNYIKDLENNVKELNAKKEELKSTQISTSKIGDIESSGCKIRPGRGSVFILPRQGGLVIEITLDYDENGGFCLSNALKVVYDEDLKVASYTSTNSNGSMLHQIVCEMNDVEYVDVRRLEQRLNALLSI